LPGCSLKSCSFTQVEKQVKPVSFNQDHVFIYSNGWALKLVQTIKEKSYQVKLHQSCS
jgi:hypothetical protein